MESLILALITSAAAAAAFLALRDQHTRIRPPVLTLAVAAVTLGVSVAAELEPPMLDLLDRGPAALAAGEWWRVFTPLLVQDGGWPGTITNTISLLVLGVLAESLVSRRAWLIVYVVSGLAGEAAAYTVMPNQGFAGNSVAILGLAAMVSVVVLVHGRGRGRVLAGAAMLLGVGLLVAGSLHGVGFCAGALAALVIEVVRPHVRDGSESTVEGSHA